MILLLANIATGQLRQLCQQVSADYDSSSCGSSNTLRAPKFGGGGSALLVHLKQGSALLVQCHCSYPSFVRNCITKVIVCHSCLTHYLQEGEWFDHRSSLNNGVSLSTHGSAMSQHYGKSVTNTRHILSLFHHHRMMTKIPFSSAIMPVLYRFLM